MPVKKENLSKYPKDWKAIRAEVLERAGHKCEQCGVPNHWYRNRKTGEVTSNAMQCEAWSYDGDQTTYIVLTVAHLNHDPTDCGEPGNRPNLKALCQRDHLAWDQEHHQRNAYHTRRKGKAIGELL